jgi:hypothetical protein
MQLLIHQILDKVSKARHKKQKIQILIENNSLGLRDILKGAFDDDIVWDLPPGPSPVTELAPADKPKLNLLNVTPKLAIMVKNKANLKIARIKKEVEYLALVKNVHPEDAAVLDLMKDKNLQSKYKGVTKATVMEAFPKLIVK